VNLLETATFRRSAWIALLLCASCDRAPEPKPGIAPTTPTLPQASETTPDAASASARAPAVPASDAPAVTGPSSSTSRSGEGWTARGSVRASAGATPVADARVLLEVRTTEGVVLDVARARSDASGAYTAALPGLDALNARDLASARVEARVEAAGFQPFEAGAGFPPGKSRDVTIEARLDEGAALRGRAVDARGAPVPRATAAISLRDGRSGPGGLTLVDETIADSEGRFALGFAAGGKFHLSLRAENVGVHARELELVARRDHDVGDVTLGGGDRLSGIALHVDGTPAKNIELWAIEGETSFQPESFATAVRRAREVERNEGLSYARAYTDEAGRFEFLALRPDHYAVKAADPVIVVEPRQARFEPGQTTLELRVETPILVVRVVDDKGTPVPRALVEATELGLEADGSYSPGGTRRAATRGARALATFSADPETPLAIRARLGERVSEERIVFFGVGTLHVEEELALGARRSNGRIRFDLVGTDAEALTMRLAVASAATRLVDEDLGLLDVGADGTVSGIPPGEHRLILDFAGDAGAWYFPWKSPAAVVVPGEGEVVVPVEPVAGARLALEGELVGPPPSGLDEAANPALHRDRFGARFVLVPAAGGPERSLDLRLGGEDVQMLLLGEKAEARDLLPAGDYMVRVEGARWMSTETRIRLLPKKRLAVRIELRSR